MSYDSLVPFPLGMLYDFVCIPIVVGALGIVEDAILLGAPVSGDEKKWRFVGQVIAGKLINGYCRFVPDWL